MSRVFGADRPMDASVATLHLSCYMLRGAYGAYSVEYPIKRALDRDLKRVIILGGLVCPDLCFGEDDSVDEIEEF